MARPVPAEFASLVPPALERIDVPAYIVGADGTIRWLNDAAIRVAGESIGRPFTGVVDMDAAEARRIFARNLSRYRSEERTIDLVERGRRTRVQLCSARLGENGHVVGMFGLAVPVVRAARRLPDSPLTKRQQEVLELLAQGASTAQIAAALTVTEVTVRNHVRQVLTRLGVRSRLGAVAAARERGLLRA
jgi:DNA-binding CsgD family transcriptional regulator